MINSGVQVAHTRPQTVPHLAKPYPNLSVVCLPPSQPMSKTYSMSRLSTPSATSLHFSLDSTYRSLPVPLPSPRVQLLKAHQCKTARVVRSSLVLTPHMDSTDPSASSEAPFLLKPATARIDLDRRRVPLYRLAVEFNKGVKLRQLVKGRAGLRDLLYAHSLKQRKHGHGRFTE